MGQTQGSCAIKDSDSLVSPPLFVSTATRTRIIEVANATTKMAGMDVMHEFSDCAFSDKFCLLDARIEL